MKKKILVTLLTIFVINSNFARIGSIGLQKVRSSVVEALKNSKKLDKNSFKKYVEESKEKKELDPKNRLAYIIQVSNGSTIKGLPTYTSKIEKEVNEQIEYTNNLVNNFIKWANQFELVELMDNERTKGIQIDVLELFAQKLDEIYQKKKTIFTDFATDLTEEQRNLTEQILILDALKDIPEVKNNEKISEKVSLSLSILSKLKNNLYKLIEKTNNLAGNSIVFLSSWLQMSVNQPPQNTASEVIENVVDTVVETMTDGITKSNAPEIISKAIPLDDEPQIISSLPEVQQHNPPQEVDSELTFQPFTLS